jgi:endogenous inhibitor of DNA gyrase (YacG/DUF329 family)
VSPESTATCPICTGEFAVSPYGSDRHIYCSRRCREEELLVTDENARSD